MTRPLVLLLMAACAAVGCRRAEAPLPTKGGGARRPTKFPVEVARVDDRPVEYAVTAVGSVAAFETVQVTSRVVGAVERVRFAEGDRVKPAQTLAEIEPQRHRLAVTASRAALAKAKAARADAQAGVERRENAVTTNPGLIPREEIATWRTRLLTADADVAEAEAAVAQAELNLRDAFVRAPMGGIIETRTVETGQYVQPGAVLATLVRRDPLLLRFTVPAPEAAQLRRGMTARFAVRGSEHRYESVISHVSSAADRESRMVAVTGEITGEAAAELRPGAFAEVTVPIGSARQAPVLAQTAVRPTERGFVAFVIEGGVARERIVNLGLRTADGRVEARSGVKAGDLVVVRGAEALRDGAPVQVERRVAEGPVDARSLHP